MNNVGALALVLAVLAGGAVTARGEAFVPSRRCASSFRDSSPAASDWMHVRIQLEGTPTVEWRAAMIPRGLRLLSYVSEHTWLASIPADATTRISQLPGVRAVHAIRPGDKFASCVQQGIIDPCSPNAAGDVRLAVTLFEDVSLSAGQAKIEALGGAVLAHDPDGNNLDLRLPAGALEALAAWDGVKWIDLCHASVDLNDGVRAAIQGDAVQAAPYDLTGSGVVIGQWESMRPDASHVDLVGRVVTVGDEWPIGDHATQVAGVMIGDGSLLKDRRYRGVAPGASIVWFHTWETVAELKQQYKQAIDVYGIDIANNSWGKVEWHVYKDYAAAMDGIVRGSLGKKLPIVWAAGNEGKWGTILCTGAAKNIVTVGATNSDDNSLWAWSNKGPTADGRIKPDVVSPGCEARNGGSIWSTLPGDRYGGACGTSLATPSVTATMALILDDWRAIHKTDPLPSTIKGLLIHTATDLGTPGPDYAYGYGQINAQKAIDLIRIDTIDDIIKEDSIFVQGERDVHTLEIGSGETELRITLVWDDYPAQPMAARALVNDLDLVVIGPGGKRYYPWTLDPYLPQQPAVRTQADRTNNVEQVCVENPPAGTWQVTVWGATVPYYNQSYSLLTSRGGLISVVSEAPLFSVTGSLGGVVAEFDEAGNLILQGRLTTEVECTPPPGAFVVRGPDQTVVAYIDLSGNMSIKGLLMERSHCAAGRGGFSLTDSLGVTVARIDADGNLCLRGTVCQNP
ncbi:MAG TPA: S8 family serine peptidase [Sedimentisphaerales bacterium]|nr:S8 family serine peptidase [Sedimentisphaerales bacterium]